MTIRKRKGFQNFAENIADNGKLFWRQAFQSFCNTLYIILF